MTFTISVIYNRISTRLFAFGVSIIYQSMVYTISLHYRYKYHDIFDSLPYHLQSFEVKQRTVSECFINAIKQ